MSGFDWPAAIDGHLMTSGKCFAPGEISCERAIFLLKCFQPAVFLTLRISFGSQVFISLCFEIQHHTSRAISLLLPDDEVRWSFLPSIVYSLLIVRPSLLLGCAQSCR
jgi:hypothetical protein